MDSEIEQLPDLAGYLKFASRGHWLRVQLQPQSGAAALAGGVPAFVPVPPTEMPASPAVTAGTGTTAPNSGSVEFFNGTTLLATSTS